LMCHQKGLILAKSLKLLYLRIARHQATPHYKLQLFLNVYL
jgi:hypothetical protein